MKLATELPVKLAAMEAAAGEPLMSRAARPVESAKVSALGPDWI